MAKKRTPPEPTPEQLAEAEAKIAAQPTPPVEEGLFDYEKLARLVQQALSEQFETRIAALELRGNAGVPASPDDTLEARLSAVERAVGINSNQKSLREIRASG